MIDEAIVLTLQTASLLDPAEQRWPATTTRGAVIFDFRRTSPRGTGPLKPPKPERKLMHCTLRAANERRSVFRQLASSHLKRRIAGGFFEARSGFRT